MQSPLGPYIWDFVCNRFFVADIIAECKRTFHRGLSELTRCPTYNRPRPASVKILLHDREMQ